MSTHTKSIASLGLIAVSIAATFAFGSLRHIGMDWTNNAGFLRLVGLAGFGAIFIVAPILLTIATWLGQPRTLPRHRA